MNYIFIITIILNVSCFIKADPYVFKDEAILRLGEILDYYFFRIGKNELLDIEQIFNNQDTLSDLNRNDNNIVVRNSLRALKTIKNNFRNPKNLEEVNKKLTASLILVGFCDDDINFAKEEIINSLAKSVKNVVEEATSKDIKCLKKLLQNVLLTPAVNIVYETNTDNKLLELTPQRKYLYYKSVSHRRNADLDDKNDNNLFEKANALIRNLFLKTFNFNKNINTGRKQLSTDNIPEECSKYFNNQLSTNTRRQFQPIDKDKDSIKFLRNTIKQFSNDEYSDSVINSILNSFEELKTIISNDHSPEFVLNYVERMEKLIQIILDNTLKNQHTDNENVFANIIKMFKNLILKSRKNTNNNETNLNETDTEEENNLENDSEADNDEPNTRKATFIKKKTIYKHNRRTLDNDDDSINEDNELFNDDSSGHEEYDLQNSSDLS